MYHLRFVTEVNFEVESFEKKKDCPRVDFLGIYTRNENDLLIHLFDLHMNEKEANKVIEGMNKPLADPIKLNCLPNGKRKAKAFLAEFDALELDPMQDLNADLPDEEGTQLESIEHGDTADIHCFSLFGHLKEGGRECLHDGTEKECLILWGQLNQLLENGHDIPKAELVLSASIMCPVCQCVSHISEDDYTLLDGTNETQCGSCNFKFKYQLELAGQTKLNLIDIDLIDEAIEFIYKNSHTVTGEPLTENERSELEQMYNSVLEYVGNDSHTLLLKDLSKRINALRRPLLEA